ncbi:PorP/SprF family type IX secretion system membrane protein [Aquimarina rhabdastrellae]
MKNLIQITVLVIGISFIGNAQQLPQFTQYMYNTISINPAYAGSRDAMSIIALNRNQWVGLNGGPVTQTFSFHTPLRKKNVGLGLSFINDRAGYENFSYLYADFSYTVQMNSDILLAMGLKAGASHFKIDEELFNDPDVFNDPFFQDRINRWTPNVGVGFHLYSHKWYASISAPRIINNDYNKENDFVALERVHYYLTGGYVFTLNPSLKFKPTVLFKFTNGAKASTDVTANFLFYNKLWFGASYRVDDAAGGLIDFQISKQFRVGYAYEYPISDLRPYTSGSHEVLLIYEFKFIKKKLKSPRYF